MGENRRYYKNPYLNFQKNDILLNENGNISDAYWSNEKIPEFITKNTNILLDFLKNDKDSDNTIYVGTPGIICALKSILQYMCNLDVDQSKTIEVCYNKMIQCLYDDNIEFTSDNPSYLLGHLGTLSIIVSEELCENNVMTSKLSAKIVSILNDINNPKYCDEFLYGRSGYLYLLLKLKLKLKLKLSHIRPFNQIVNLDSINQTCASIIKSGRHFFPQSEFTPKLCFSWHGKIYLGAAHGFCGIFYHLLDPLCLKCSSVMEALEDIKMSIDWLFSLISESGNIPSSYMGNDILVQWCHGAAGAVYLAIRCHKVFKDSKYLEIAINFGSVIWQKGILTKSVGICHGVAGNGYAFLALYNYTGETNYLYFALKFAHWIVNNYYKYPLADRPMSLYEGLAGVLHYLVDLYHPSSAKFPGYQNIIDVP